MVENADRIYIYELDGEKMAQRLFRGGVYQLKMDDNLRKYEPGLYDPDGMKRVDDEEGDGS